MPYRRGDQIIIKGFVSHKARKVRRESKMFCEHAAEAYFYPRGCAGCRNGSLLTVPAKAIPSLWPPWARTTGGSGREEKESKALSLTEPAGYAEKARCFVSMIMRLPDPAHSPFGAGGISTRRVCGLPEWKPSHYSGKS